MDMSRGGKRKGAGRPAGKPRKLMNFSLSIPAVEIVTQQPRGERSEFVDKAILQTQKETSLLRINPRIKKPNL
jgi:hypothetical protein